MGVGADEDEFEMGGGGIGMGVRAEDDADADAEEEEEDQRRIFRDASVEQNNDIVSRFMNLLKYILVIRCGSEMPMRYFDIPTDSGVGGNVFSQFISSIVPVEGVSASAAAGLPSGIPYFHVGIGPFIAASIAMQVLVAVIPSLKAWIAPTRTPPHTHTHTQTHTHTHTPRKAYHSPRALLHSPPARKIRVCLSEASQPSTYV